MRITLDGQEYHVSGYAGNISCSRIGAIEYTDQQDLSFFGRCVLRFFQPEKILHNNQIISIIANADCWWGWYLYQNLPSQQNCVFLIQEESSIFSLLGVKNNCLAFYRIINILDLERELQIAESFLQTEVKLIRVNTENSDLSLSFDTVLKSIAISKSENYIYLSYLFYIIPGIQSLYLIYSYYVYFQLENKLKQYKQLPQFVFYGLLSTQYNFSLLLGILNEFNNIYYKDKILKIQSSRLQQVLEILKYYKLQIQHQAKRDLKAMSGTIYVAIP